MLRWVLILSAACVVLIAVLALTRGDGPTLTRGEPPEKAPAAEDAAQPAVAKAPEPKQDEPPAAPVEPPPVDQQVEEDAAAVGMTTVEPRTPPETPSQPNP